MSPHTVLVSGSTGAVGAQLVPALLDAGHTVRVLARTPDKLEDAWRHRVQIVEGDAEDEADVARALDGVDVAYYLLHSMDADGDFRRRDRELATTFAKEAERAQLGRIVYLSGLHPDGELSEHLASRVEVGDIFLASSVPTAVLQAGVVLGDGSASFDMLRHLTERLPVAVGPKWLRNRIQPIAIEDAVHYLVSAADLPTDVNRTIDIGMDEQLTYIDMMKRYAKAVGLWPRLIGTVPVLTPKLASYWVGLVTPVSSDIARPLVGSLIHDAVKGESDASNLLGDPPNGLLEYEEAVLRASETLDPKRWSRTFAAVGAGVAACAVVGSLLTQPRSRWYKRLRKPAWQPAPQAFPLVWTTLYALIAVSGTSTIADLSEKGSEDDARSFAKALAVNLVLNAAWSGLLFRARNLALATAGAAALAASSGDLARRAAPAGPGKAVSLGLYAAWCAFATVLSGEITRLNRGRTRDR